MSKQGVAISPCASFLFAAGEDNRIRTWNIRDPLCSDPISVQTASPPHFQPYSQTRPHPQYQPESGPDQETTVDSLAHTTFHDIVVALQVRYTERCRFESDADNGGMHTRYRRQAEVESADAYGGRSEGGEMMMLWAAEGKRLWTFGIECRL
jgi:hypothetical protein